MAGTLRGMYEALGAFSTATHTSICKDLLRRLEASGKDDLARLFVEAAKGNANSDQIERPFLNKDLLDSRKGLHEKSTGTNKVVQAMKAESPLTVALPDPYAFRYLEREVPHLRTLHEQKEKGWIDYIAVSDQTPILGEIKYESDQNPFYAFVQLITYLSEIATEQQIRRAINHGLFGDAVKEIPAFDLHIFLVDFRDDGKKGELVGLTRQLAVEFKRRLRRLALEDSDPASKVGRIICMSAEMEQKGFRFRSLECRWVA